MGLKTLITFQDAIEAEKERLAKRPNAAKLCSGIYWICFYAERTGDWHLHLVSLKKMLNLFIATRQRNYAKSASLICLIGI